jgi:polar amino acid transport system permease protein
MGGAQTFWEQLWVARFALLNGLAVTAQVSAIAIAIGSLIGMAGGVVLQYGPRPARWIVRGYSDLLRGIPVLVLILFSFYGLSLIGVQISPTTAGIVALAGFCGAHLAEVARGAIGSIPLGQTEAAKAMGMGFWRRLWYVILPQAVRRILPPWVNTGVEIVKGSTLLTAIGVVELLLATQQAIARTYAVIPFYLTAWVIYVLINFTISQLGAALERRFGYLKY